MITKSLIGRRETLVGENGSTYGLFVPLDDPGVGLRAALAMLLVSSLCPQQ